MSVCIFWIHRNTNGLSREDLEMLWNFKIQFFNCGTRLALVQYLQCFL